MTYISINASTLTQKILRMRELGWIASSYSLHSTTCFKTSFQNWEVFISVIESCIYLGQFSGECPSSELQKYHANYNTCIGCEWDYLGGKEVCTTKCLKVFHSTKNSWDVCQNGYTIDSVFRKRMSFIHSKAFKDKCLAT